MKNKTEEIEELIIQGLAHRERRNILKIISLAEGGAVYSDILGELGLNTGTMNYHLRQLEGLLERNGDRKYHISPLGKKALGVLHSMTENLENGYEQYITAARSKESSMFSTYVNRIFYIIVIFTLSAYVFLTNFVRMEVVVGSWPRTSYYYLAGFGLLVIAVLVWLRSFVMKEAEKASEWWIRLIDRIT
ncbi:MAG: helix-turn-helix transcriptional regulator, partial [Candidatus Bathyarchaeota archaeon]